MNDDSMSDKKKRKFIFDTEFKEKDQKKIMEETKMLENIIGKKIKVWCVFNDSIGGVRGLMKGTVGILNAVDAEFIQINDSILLSRKFILRIELV